jgi:copper chaperone CopZ
MLGRTAFDDFLLFYEYQNRSVQEQQLNLSIEQKTAFYYFLRENNKPENQTYPYDFFYNNCANKITDAIETVLGEQISYNPPSSFEQQTFRNLIRSDLNQNSWGSLGIDVALGSKIDQLASVKEHLFLPKYLYLLLENAQVESKELKLVKKLKILTPTTFVKTSEGFGSPIVILSLVAFIMLFVTFKDNKNNKRSKWLDVILFATTGIIGLVILMLWFATDHTATANNYNLLWAFAANLLFIPSILKTRLNNRGIKYIVFLTILLSLMLLHWMTGVQSFAIGLIPILIAIGVRYLFLIRHFNKAIRV